MMLSITQLLPVPAAPVSQMCGRQLGPQIRATASQPGAALHGALQ